MVLGDPDRVEAGLVGETGLRERLPVGRLEIDQAVVGSRPLQFRDH